MLIAYPAQIWVILRLQTYLDSFTITCRIQQQQHLVANKYAKDRGCNGPGCKVLASFKKCSQAAVSLPVFKIKVAILSPE